MEVLQVPQVKDHLEDHRDTQVVHPETREERHLEAPNGTDHLV